jgi:hypothetical protein
MDIDIYIDIDIDIDIDIVAVQTNDHIRLEQNSKESFKNVFSE